MMNIEQIIEERLQDIDLEKLVRDEIRMRVGDDIARLLKIGIKEKIDEIIRAEIEITMSKPIVTDDGWGKRENFQSFDALFKKIFSERIGNEWEMKKQIEKQVKEKVDSLFRENFSAVATRIAEELTKQVNKN